MRIDTSRIDDRIKKLEEVKRIAADPEMVALLLEFLGIGTEAPRRGPAPVRAMDQERDEPPGEDPPCEDVDALIDHVIKSVPVSRSWDRRR